MKLSSFLTAVGFLTLSVAIHAPTPTFTGVNAVPASSTIVAVMPEPTLLPRYTQKELDAICEWLRSGNWVEYSDPGPWTTSTLPIKWPRHLTPRKIDVESACSELKQGIYGVYNIPKHHKNTIYIDED